MPKKTPVSRTETIVGLAEVGINIGAIATRFSLQTGRAVGERAKRLAGLSAGAAGKISEQAIEGTYGPVRPVETLGGTAELVEKLKEAFNDPNDSKALFEASSAMRRKLQNIQDGSILVRVHKRNDTTPPTPDGMPDSIFRKVENLDIDYSAEELMAVTIRQIERDALASPMPRSTTNFMLYSLWESAGLTDEEPLKDIETDAMARLLTRQQVGPHSVVTPGVPHQSFQDA